MNFGARYCPDCCAYMGIGEWEHPLWLFPHMPGCSKGQREERERALDELAEANRWQ